MKACLVVDRRVEFVSWYGLPRSFTECIEHEIGEMILESQDLVAVHKELHLLGFFFFSTLHRIMSSILKIPLAPTMTRIIQR